MDILELEIRKRLGQKKFEPINEQKHLRFDFSCNKKINKKIIEIFDDFFEEMNDIIVLKFYKGQCLFFIEELTYDWHNPYREVFIKDYTGFGTIEIIKDLIINNSTIYKRILRDIQINKLLK